MHPRNRTGRLNLRGWAQASQRSIRLRLFLHTPSSNPENRLHRSQRQRRGLCHPPRLHHHASSLRRRLLPHRHRHPKRPTLPRPARIRQPYRLRPLRLRRHDGARGAARTWNCRPRLGPRVIRAPAETPRPRRQEVRPRDCVHADHFPGQKSHVEWQVAAKDQRDKPHVRIWHCVGGGASGATCRCELCGGRGAGSGDCEGGA